MVHGLALFSHSAEMEEKGRGQSTMRLGRGCAPSFVSRLSCGVVSLRFFCLRTCGQTGWVGSVVWKSDRPCPQIEGCRVGNPRPDVRSNIHAYGEHRWNAEVDGSGPRWLGGWRCLV